MSAPKQRPTDAQSLPKRDPVRYTSGDDDLTEAIKKLGRPRGLGTKLQIDVARAALRREQGFSLPQIAEDEGVSVSTVQRRLRDAQ